MSRNADSAAVSSSIYVLVSSVFQPGSWRAVFCRQTYSQERKTIWAVHVEIQKNPLNPLPSFSELASYVELILFW